MLRRAALLLPLAWLCACASAPQPSLAPLCGIWTEPQPGTRYERWYVEGEDLLGDLGTILEDGELLQTQHRTLLTDPRGPIYYTMLSGHVTPTKFRPIDPARSRFGASAPEGARIWVWANYRNPYPQEIRYVLFDDERLEVAYSGPEGEGVRMSGWTFERTGGCARSRSAHP